MLMVKIIMNSSLHPILYTKILYYASQIKPSTYYESLMRLSEIYEYSNVSQQDGSIILSHTIDSVLWRPLKRMKFQIIAEVGQEITLRCTLMTSCTLNRISNP